MKPDSHTLTAIDAGVIVVISGAICIASDKLLFMSIFVPATLALRMVALYALRRRENINFRAELAFFLVCTLLGAYNDYNSVCVKGIYSYTVPHAFAWSTIPLWMLLYWGMILRMFARVARWRALNPPEKASNAVGIGKYRFDSPLLKIVVMMVLIFITRQMIYQYYLHPLWSWLPFIIALSAYMLVCKPDKHDVTMMAIVLPVGPLVEILYINVGKLHAYHLGIVGGVPLWIIAWWLLIIVIWKDVSLRLETWLAARLADNEST